MRRQPRFLNRRTAGRELAERVAALGLERPIVVALPRGGVPVGVEVARALGAPLDLAFVRKIGVPGQPELAAAAVIDGGEAQIVINEEIASAAGIDRRHIERRAKGELAEIERRRRLYLAGIARSPLEGRALVVVDDGIATGASIKAALQALRRRAPSRLVLAVPIAARETLSELAPLVDDVVCLEAPSSLGAIGMHYADFHQVPDEEVLALLKEALAFRPSGATQGKPAASVEAE